MKAITQLVAILTGNDHFSEMYFQALKPNADIEVSVDIERVAIVNNNGSVSLVPHGDKIEVEATNLHGSKIVIADAYSALNFALMRLDIRLDPEDEDRLGVLPTGYPVLPIPNCTFADHSAKAFTQEQMFEYARAAVSRFAGMSLYEIDAQPVPFDQMVQEHPVEWCSECGGQIGDDCSCEEDEDDDEDDEDWEHADCDRCGCDKDSCDCDVETPHYGSIAPHNHMPD